VKRIGESSDGGAANPFGRAITVPNFGAPRGAGSFDGDRSGNYIWAVAEGRWYAANDPNRPARFQTIAAFQPSALDQYHNPQQPRTPSPTPSQIAAQRAYRRWRRTMIREEVSKRNKQIPKKASKGTKSKAEKKNQRDVEAEFSDYEKNDVLPSWMPRDRTPSPEGGAGGTTSGGMVPYDAAFA
jgi:hypothetical protein